MSRMTSSCVTNAGHANILPNTGQENNIAQPKLELYFFLAFRFVFHRYRPFTCCLKYRSVVLQMGYPENLVLLCPNNQRSLKPFNCLDRVFTLFFG